MTLLPMSPRLLAGEAFRALVRRKLQSGLTALGITIGIAAVVWVVALGKAGAERVEAQLENLGENFVWIEEGSRNLNGLRTGSHGTTTLTLEDVDAIRREVPLIKSASPNVDARVQVVYEGRNWNTGYRGVSPEYFDIRRWELADGARFTDDDVQRVASVCVIGRVVREQLFGTQNAVGQLIRIQAQLFKVVGVLAAKGQSATGQDQDDTILLPYTTAQSKLRGKRASWLDDILCSAISRPAIEPAIVEVSKLLRQRHHLRPGDDDDFNIRRPDAQIKAQSAMNHTLELLLVCIASVSLITGGIGIMNVMLASVAQRTSEIGLRLAIGATETAIKVQFLGEAVLLSLLGGAMGVVLSVVGSSIFSQLSEWPMSISLDAVLVALAFSVAVGVFFGFYPARAAARLDPIAALRHE